MKLSKKNLLSLINENLSEMAMDFDTADRPNPDLQSKLASGDTPLKKIPFPKTGNEPNQNFQELLASERYRQIVNNVRQYTNYQGTLNGTEMGPLLTMMYTAHNNIIRLENTHKEALEQLAIEIVKEEMGIGEEVEFDAKIVGMNQIDTSDFNREQGPEQNPDEVDVEDGEEDDEENNQEQPQVNPENQEVEEELYIDLKQLDLERAKLTLINSIIQGASKRGHYMYQLVGEKLREITGSDELYNDYGVMMSVNDANYWQFSPSMIKGASDSVAGKVKTEFPGDDETGETGDEGEEGGEEQEEQKVKVIARGINFPVLIHELIKGVFEILGSHGQPGEYTNPQDRAMYQQAQKLESTLEKEMWTLLLGPAIWDRIRGQFPDEVILENGKQLQNYMLMHIFQLPAKQFLVLMKEVVSNSENGKRLMTDLMASIQQMFNQQDYEESLNQFNDELETMSDETEPDDLKDFLKGFNIDLSSDDGDDGDDLDDLFRQLGIDKPKE
jgi:hypothetical protein